MSLLQLAISGYLSEGQKCFHALASFGGTLVESLLHFVNQENLLSQSMCQQGMYVTNIGH